MLRKDQFCSAQVREDRDWWACPADVANAWRATRRRGSDDRLARQAGCERWAQGPTFAVLRKDQFCSAQVRQSSDWWACPADVANAWRATRRRGSEDRLAHQAGCERWAQGPTFAVLRKDQFCSVQVRQSSDWWACPADVANAWRATRRRGSDDLLAHQAGCEPWAQGPSSLCRVKTNFVIPKFARTATGGLVPPKSQMLGVLHGGGGAMIFWHTKQVANLGLKAQVRCVA